VGRPPPPVLRDVGDVGAGVLDWPHFEAGIVPRSDRQVVLCSHPPKETR
jgi:hypothetical protein